MYWIESLSIPNNYLEIKNLVLQANTKIQCESREVLSISQHIGKQYQKFNVTSVFKEYNYTFEDAVLAWYIKRRFSQYKQIYILNSTLYEELKKTTGIETINSSIINNLPVDSFYIDMNQCNLELSSKEKIEGAFISIDKFKLDNEEKQELNIILKISTNNSFYFVSASLPTKEEATLTEQTNHWNTSCSEELRDYFKDVLQLILYLCSDDIDVVKRPRITSSKSNSKSKTKKEKPTTILDLGYRIGNDLRKSRIVYEEESNNHIHTKGSSKVPHIRRPHWAVYHVGKGRTETVLKWINLIVVNKSKGELSPTAHKIK